MNDVGLVEVNGRRVVVAVFVTEARLSREDAEAVLAGVARTVHGELARAP